MFFEYAIAPEVIAQPDHARFLLEACRPWKGRFVAMYPKAWAEMVLATTSDAHRKAVEVRLVAAAGAGAFLRGRTIYDDTKPWLSNAEAEHVRTAFRAIISAEERDEAHIVEASKAEDAHARWRVDSGRMVDRDPAQVVALLRLLLQVSSHVAYVDPHFRADQADKASMLAAFCRALRTTVVPVEVHWSDEPQGMPSYKVCMGYADRALPGMLPLGVSVTLKCWRQRSGGDRLHNRYLLTDVAGVQFGDSIERGSAGEQDRVSILDEPSRAKLWAQYVQSPGGFDSGGSAKTFVGTSKGP